MKRELSGDRRGNPTIHSVVTIDPNMMEVFVRENEGEILGDVANGQSDYLQHHDELQNHCLPIC